VITDGRGIPLAVTLTGGHRNDVTQLIPLIEAIPAVRGRRGRPRRRPGKVFADRGYDRDKYRALVKGKGIRPLIACRGTPHGSGLGVYRYVVEQAIALLHWFPAAAHPLGDPRRHPRSLPHPRLRHHLLAPPQDPRFVLGPLSRASRRRCHQMSRPEAW
jgi:hypothetical protein